MYRTFKQIRHLYRKLAQVENRLATMRWWEPDFTMSRLERLGLVKAIMKAREI